MAARKPQSTRRVEAAEAAVRRFSGAPFRWSSNDCARLAAFTLRRLGHKPPMPKAGSYSSARGARKALKAAGFDSLEAALDSFLRRVPPPLILPGDILAFPTEGEHSGWVGLGVALGNGNALTFHGPAHAGTVLAMSMPPAIAWSAL